MNNLIPSTEIKFETPTVVYNLTNPIRSKIFNFNQFTSKFDINAFLNDENILPCHCEESPFRDTHHNHIVSGNLKIIDNNKLRKLLSKGPKYREPKKLCWEESRLTIVEGLKSCVKKWCDDNGMTPLIFSEWQHNLVGAKIEMLKKSTTTDCHKDILSDFNVKKSLIELYEKFVLTPIDKATGNVAIICKRFYAQTLIKELDMSPSGIIKQNHTYKGETLKSSEIVKQHKNDLEKMFKIKVDNDNECIPHMYWLPKMHKSPIKSRFIIAYPKSSIKPLAIAITSDFKVLFHQIENYSKNVISFQE